MDRRASHGGAMVSNQQHNPRAAYAGGVGGGGGRPNRGRGGPLGHYADNNGVQENTYRGGGRSRGRGPRGRKTERTPMQELTKVDMTINQDAPLNDMAPPQMAVQERDRACFEQPGNGAGQFAGFDEKKAGVGAGTNLEQCNAHRFVSRFYNLTGASRVDIIMSCRHPTIDKDLEDTAPNRDFGRMIQSEAMDVWSCVDKEPAAAPVEQGLSRTTEDYAVAMAYAMMAGSGAAEDNVEMDPKDTDSIEYDEK